MTDSSWWGLRLSDADRQAAVDLLSEQYAQGRLTRDELDERSDAVWSAKIHGDLSPLFADLPAGTSRTAAWPSGRVPARESRFGPLSGVRRVLVPLLVVLVVLTVLTHLPLILIAVAVWFLLFRVRGRRWHHHSAC